jgi:threonine aldolase
VRAHDPTRRNFGSDNNAGAHPEVLAALAEANGGHVTSYGADPYTAKLSEVMKGHFGPEAQTFPVFNGTGANVLSLQAASAPWGAVICAQGSHVNTDENGAAERVAGLKLLPVAAPDGKLTPALVDQQAWGFGDEHHAQPCVVSLSQSTEVGTVYTLEEMTALCRHAHSLGLKVHVDGARLVNAAASLGTSLGEVTTGAGVDIVSLGGTKNGLLFAEAVVATGPGLAEALKYLRKMDMQLGSKMRFLSAQLLAMYDGDLWLRSARHANAMAARLSARAAALPGVRLTQPTQANGVFLLLPPGVADKVRARFSFYDWDHFRGEVRWMCAFDTTPEDVDALVAEVAAAIAAGAA